MSCQTIIVVGAGAAALSFAAAMPPSYEVIVITKESVHDSNSTLAQGGIATSIMPEDSIVQHAEDTLYAGCGHNHVETVNDAIVDGHRLVHELISQAFPFDKDQQGRLRLEKRGALGQPDFACRRRCDRKNADSSFSRQARFECRAEGV